MSRVDPGAARTPGDPEVGTVALVLGRSTLGSMYLPKHFRAGDAETEELLTGIRTADLITPSADGLYATFLPLIYAAQAGGPEVCRGTWPAGTSIGVLRPSARPW